MLLWLKVLLSAPRHRMILQTVKCFCLLINVQQHQPFFYQRDCCKTLRQEEYFLHERSMEMEPEENVTIFYDFHTIS